jgi:imidazoleglycerol-phosphate dehydratase/histidinol-phosphatase
MKKVLFIDRDGTMILETDDFKIETMEKIIFYPEIFYWLGRIVREFDYELVLVTNQDGLGTDVFPNEPFYTTHRFIMNVFAGEKIIFSEECIDCSYPHENLPTRKPGTGMLTKYFSPDYDLKNSFVIGDRITDVVLAKNLGAKAFWLNDGRGLGVGEIKETRESLHEYIAVESRQWEDIYNYLSNLNNPFA